MAEIDQRRWPDGGLTDAQLVEIRKLKARVEAERLPRGADPERHTKLGPGGLADVEWTVQTLQLQHAYRLPALRSTRTVVALRAAREAGIIDPLDAGQLEEAWRMASRIRNSIMLMRGRASDSIPSDTRELRLAGRAARLRAGGVLAPAGRLPPRHPAGPRGRRPGVLGRRLRLAGDGRAARRRTTPIARPSMQPGGGVTSPPT